MFCFDFSLMPLVAESGIFCICTRVASSVVALLCIHQVPKATIVYTYVAGVAPNYDLTGSDRAFSRPIP